MSAQRDPDLPRGVHHTGYTVSNLERSLDFYQGLLGLELIGRQDKQGGYLGAIVGYPDAHVRQAHLRIPGDGHVVELFEYLAPKGSTPAPFEPRNVGTPHLCLLTDDLPGALRAPRRSGRRHVRESAGPGRHGLQHGRLRAVPAGSRRDPGRAVPARPAALTAANRARIARGTVRFPGFKGPIRWRHHRRPLNRSPQMTSHAPSSIDTRTAESHGATERAKTPLALLEVASALVESARKLVPSCTVAIGVEIGSAWQVLARCGTVDVTADWRSGLAVALPCGEHQHQGDGYAVSAFPTKNLRALLILLAEPAADVPSRVHATVRTLLHEGGRLLDEALAAQEHDRAVRRVTLLERARRGVRPSRVTHDVEDAISSLWPRASVHFHDLDTLRDAPWSTARTRPDRLRPRPAGRRRRDRNRAPAGGSVLPRRDSVPVAPRSLPGAAVGGRRASRHRERRRCERGRAYGRAGRPTERADDRDPHPAA